MDGDVAPGGPRGHPPGQGRGGQVQALGQPHQLQHQANKSWAILSNLMVTMSKTRVTLFELLVAMSELLMLLKSFQAVKYSHDVTCYLVAPT